jgi:uncharacterized protein (TIGR02118 family)
VLLDNPLPDRRRACDKAVGAASRQAFQGVPVIKVYILHPNQPGMRFDMAYYCERHMPMVQARIGTACTGFTVDAGLAGGAPGQPAP